MKEDFARKPKAEKRSRSWWFLCVTPTSNYNLSEVKVTTDLETYGFLSICLPWKSKVRNKVAGNYHSHDIPKNSRSNKGNVWSVELDLFCGVDIFHLSNEKRAPGCVGYTGGWKTTQAYRDYNEPIIRIPSLTNQDSMESKARFFFVAHLAPFFQNVTCVSAAGFFPAGRFGRTCRPAGSPHGTRAGAWGGKSSDGFSPPGWFGL